MSTNKKYDTILPLVIILAMLAFFFYMNRSSNWSASDVAQAYSCGVQRSFERSFHNTDNSDPKYKALEKLCTKLQYADLTSNDAAIQKCFSIYNNRTSNDVSSDTVALEAMHSCLDKTKQ